MKIERYFHKSEIVVRNDEGKIILVQVGRSVFALKHLLDMRNPEDLKNLLDNPHIDLRLLKEKNEQSKNK